MTGQAELNLYFDNAATSWPKPETVYEAAGNYLRRGGGNPGRTGHTRTLEADRVIYRAREQLARLFNAADPSRIAFTLNATDALNMALKGILQPGDHVLFTAMEHNSVLRPLGGLRRAGAITTTMVPCSREGLPDLDFLEQAFQPRTRLVVFSHASNVCGTILPLNEITALAHRHGSLVLVDAAQSAGVVPVDVSAAAIDLLAFAGHKGLLGPPGTGGLYAGHGVTLKPWREGGTGSRSEMDLHPETMPELLEAGTMNTPGLAGLSAGLEFIEETGITAIREHEVRLYARLHAAVKAIPGVTVHGPADPALCTAVLSFTMEGVDCGELGCILESAYGLLCRTGLHCAPLAHQALGTFPEGTVRLSPGFFTREADIDYLAGALAEIASLRG
jgi:cysteine desulfurase / selenocysteine lyase